MTDWPTIRQTDEYLSYQCMWPQGNYTLVLQLENSLNHTCLKSECTDTCGHYPVFSASKLQYILLHTLAYSCTLLHTLAYSCILLHTLAYSCILTNAPHSCHMLGVGSTGIAWDPSVVAVSEPVTGGNICWLAARPVTLHVTN